MYVIQAAIYIYNKRYENVIIYDCIDFIGTKATKIEI